MYLLQQPGKVKRNKRKSQCTFYFETFISKNKIEVNFYFSGIKPINKALGKNNCIIFKRRCSPTAKVFLFFRKMRHIKDLFR